MAKLTTTDLTSLSNETSAVNTINANNAAIETALENTVSRDGTSPNQMTADFDLNGNDLLNVGAVTFSSGSAGVVGLQGPATSTDNALARWNGTNGSTLDNSGWTITDSDVLEAAATLDMNGNSITGVLSITMNGSGTFSTGGGDINVGAGDFTMTGGSNTMDLNCAALSNIGAATFCAAGSLDMNWATTKEHCEVSNTASSSSNAVTLDLTTGNHFVTTLTENISTTTFSNPPGTGKFMSFSWEIIQDAGASGYTVAFPASVDWAGGSAPTLTATASAVDVFTFVTRDGGTTWYGGIFGQDFS